MARARTRPWTEHACLGPRRDAGDRWDEFEADACWFYRKGFWLPATMLLDAWLCMTLRGKVNRRCIVGGKPTARAYHSWLEGWWRVAAERLRRGHGADGVQVRLAPAIVLARVARELYRGSTPPAAIDRRDLEPAARAMLDHPATAAAYALFAPAAPEERTIFPLSVRDFPALRFELTELPHHRIGTLFADRTALGYLLSAEAPRLRGLDYDPPLALGEGLEGRGTRRSERGPFRERGTGPVPPNPAHLSPIEFLYQELVPLYATYRMAAGQVSRSFSDDLVLNRRRPTLSVEIGVQEEAGWHRVRPGEPLGAVSTVRAAVAEILLRMSEALRSLDLIVRARLDWRGPAWPEGAAAAWRESCLLGKEGLAPGIDHRAGRLERLVARLPVLLLPPHGIDRLPGRGWGEDDADLTIRISCGAERGFRGPGGSGDDATRRELWLTPAEPGRITWGITTRARAEMGGGWQAEDRIPSAAEEIVRAALTDRPWAEEAWDELVIQDA